MPKHHHKKSHKSSKKGSGMHKKSSKKGSMKASLLSKSSKHSKKSSYGGSQLKRDLRSLERLLGGYSSTGGKAESTGRYFTVHTVDGKDAKVVLKGDTGRYEMTKSGGPLSAAKKAYTSLLHKLGLKSKGSSTELSFVLREVTKDPEKRVGSPLYGPYYGIRVTVPEKARDKFMKKHGIKHRSLVHLSGKKNLKVGGSCGANHNKPKKGGNVIAKTAKIITKTGKATIATGVKAARVSAATLASSLTPQGLSAAVATGALVAASRRRTSKKGGSSCGSHNEPKKGGNVIAKTAKIIKKTGKNTIATGVKAANVSAKTLATSLTPHGLTGAITTGALVAASRRRTSKKGSGLKSRKSSKKASLSKRHSKKGSGMYKKSHSKKTKASLKRSYKQKKQMGGDFWSFFN